jgi:general secretion pathway protein G
MEVLLVLAILVILGSLAAMSFRGVMSDSDIKAAQSQVGLFKTPVELYLNTFRTYPPTLQALVAAPPDVDQAKWQRIIGPSFPSGLPKDPWGHDYKFAAPGTHNASGYDIWSSGPDGADGTEDDVGNWGPPK